MRNLRFRARARPQRGIVLLEALIGVLIFSVGGGNRQQTAAVRYGGAGTWMFHCHILEHAERGMMGELVLEP